MSADTPFDSRAFLRTLTALPGVYRMLDAEGAVLYVGKARNLRRRVASYFRTQAPSAKVASLVRHTHAMEVTVTHTEGEALLLESNLIKQYRPRYNVLLRDDKGYPWIHLSAGPHGRLRLHRGPQRSPGRYFGPYPSTQAVRETLYLLQKTFRLRQCDDAFFANRSRPCLQYQIRRCSGPCTGMIGDADYQHDVDDVVRFLEGRGSEVIQTLVERMQAASEALEFEQAARLRDQIAQLREVQQRQYVSRGGKGDFDIIACRQHEGVACLQVLFFRQGKLLGNRAHFPHLPERIDDADLLAAFLAQYYLDKPPPSEIILEHEPNEMSLLDELLARQHATLSLGQRGERRRWVEMAIRNAEHALKARLGSRSGLRRRHEALHETLDLDAIPERIECFDISHTAGEATVAACVVFDLEGARKSDYRRFNIEGETQGDDYAALAQAVRRRYRRILDGETPRPDLLLIDGGAGQLNRVQEVLEELGAADIPLLAVSKGPERRPGLEQLHRLGEPPLRLDPHSPALHLIQHIRDEAHRFAITGHRARRSKARTQSVLEHIPGIGARRRQQLLQQFGGVQQIKRAGIEDLCRIPGISHELAQRIYDAFHEQS